MLIDIVRMTSLHAGSRGVGNTKFIPSFPRMARVLGAPRGRRVGLTVNLLATTTLGTEKSAFYPFPDENFFLLYCYAHGIMRPKVRNTCFSADCSSYPGAHKGLEEGW